MEPTAADLARETLLTFGAILSAGVVAATLARRASIPDVVAFLLAGLLLGPSALGLVSLEADSEVNQLILIFGSSFILFDGGASIRLGVMREVWRTVVVLATVGVLVTAAITALGAHLLLGVPLIVAALLGAAIASTDPATLIPVLRRIRLRARLSQTALAESAFNDAVGAIATLAVVGIALDGSSVEPGSLALDFAVQVGIGTACGVVLGYAVARLLSSDRLPIPSEHARFVLVAALTAAYVAAVGLGASGFIAVFVFGVVLGNGEALGLRHRIGDDAAMVDFVSTTSLLMRMCIFVLLGSQVDVDVLGRHAVEALGVVLVLVFVARPVTVFVCALPDRRARWTLRELLLLSWVRETGVMAAALAGILIGLNAPQAEMIASVVFLAILFTIVVQATTTAWLAGRLGLLADSGRPISGETCAAVPGTLSG